jgi:phospholipid/cholesterol/gamma-HCH transport system substrate-binding protein
MSSRVSHFQIGLFVLGTLLLVLAALFWIGAMEFYQETRKYVTYIDSSVEGLSPGSKVRYRGLSVGRVAGIGLARDKEMIRIDLEIQPDFRIRDSHAVQLKLKGITGKRYLALIKASPEMERITPPEGTAPEEPWIPSVPGQMERMVHSMQAMYNELRSVDIQGLGKQWRNVAAQASDLLRSKELNATLERVNILAAELEALVGNLREARPGERWSAALRELSRSAETAEELITSLERRVDAVSPQDMARIPERTNAVLGQIGKSANATSQRIGTTTALLQQSILELNRVLSEIRMLTRTLQRDPGRILTRPENKEDPFGR